MSKQPVTSRHLCVFCKDFLGNSNVIIWLTTASSSEGQSNPVYKEVHDWIREHTIASREDLDYDGIAVEGRTLITLRTRASLAIASDQGCSYCMHDLLRLDYLFQEDGNSIIFTYDARDYEPYTVSQEDVCLTSRAPTKLAASIIDTIHVGQLRAYEDGIRGKSGKRRYAEAYRSTWYDIGSQDLLLSTHCIIDSAAAIAFTTEDNGNFCSVGYGDSDFSALLSIIDCSVMLILNV